MGLNRVMRLLESQAGEGESCRQKILAKMWSLKSLVLGRNSIAASPVVVD